MRKFISVLFLIAILAVLPFKVYAYPVLDTGSGGSITVIMQYEDKPLKDGSLAFYRVAEITEENGKYSYVLTESFAPSNLSISDIESPALAEELKKYAEKEKIIPEKADIKDGKAFLNIGKGRCGLYLAVHETPSKGYDMILPFLINVPEYKDGKYEYDVKAYPKIKQNMPPIPPPVSSEDDTIPQTGQNNLPVPILAGTGLLLLTAGVILLRYGKRD